MEGSWTPISRCVVDVVSGPPPRTRPPHATDASAPAVDVLAELLLVLPVAAPLDPWVALDAVVLDAVADVPGLEVPVDPLPFEPEVAAPVVEAWEALDPAEAGSPLDVDSAPAWVDEAPPEDDGEPHPAKIPSPLNKYPETARALAMPLRGGPPRIRRNDLRERPSKPVSRGRYALRAHVGLDCAA
jgi:hypothetical protein